MKSNLASEYFNTDCSKAVVMLWFSLVIVIFPLCYICLLCVQICTEARHMNRDEY